MKITQLSKEITDIIDKRVNFQHMFSLFDFHITHYCKWKYQPTFMSALHLSIACLAVDIRVQQNLTKAFCVNELATWMEFIIKGFVYLIICKFYVLYPLYQENNKFKYAYTYMYIHIWFIFMYSYILAFMSIPLLTAVLFQLLSSLLTALPRKLTFFPLLQNLVQNKFVT